MALLLSHVRKNHFTYLFIYLFIFLNFSLGGGMGGQVNIEKIF